MADVTPPPPARPPRRLRPPSPRVTLIVAALCALALIWVSESTHQRIARAMGQIQTAHTLRLAVHALQRELAEAESSQRGFVLTGDRKYLEPYADAVAEIARQLKTLGSLAPREMGESEPMRVFRDLLSQKLGEMALAVRMREEERPEVAQFVVSSHTGLERMRVLRLQGTALAAEADAQLAALHAEVYRLLYVSRLGMAAGILAAFVAFFLYVNQARALRKADVRQQQALEAERDMLESQVRERTARLAELATHLQQAVEDERAHLARELHDELGALLTAAKLDVARLKSRLPAGADDMVERLKHLTETLNQGIALKRRIIEDLRPSALSNLGLVASLDILAREFAERSGLRVHTALEPVGLDPNCELTIYRLVQEALTNIGKHARAREVSITLKNYVNHAEVAVADDGAGFDPARLRQGSHGLAGMRHRVEAAGGRLDIRSTPSQGTRITGTVPRRAAMPQAQLARSMEAMSLSADSHPGGRPPPASGPAPG
ncbi:CHASE3 domain-containing protein [Ottowia sp.]|uniref:CHASE3 domain-containing protein n=1 Tax=Ottowia sp. TaxID=1898956 RepID=UPI0039E44FE0